MKDYSEILKSIGLAVADPPVEPEGELTATDPVDDDVVAPCGSPHCAGCYDLGDGRKIHPPKAGMNHAEAVASVPLSKVLVPCSHCRGEKTCSCISCWEDGPGKCVNCHGRGRCAQWVQ